MNEINKIKARLQSCELRNLDIQQKLVEKVKRI